MATGSAGEAPPSPGQIVTSAARIHQRISRARAAGLPAVPAPTTDKADQLVAEFREERQTGQGAV